MNISPLLPPQKSLRQLTVVLLFGIVLFSLALFIIPVHAQVGLVTCGLSHGTTDEQSAFCTICDLIVLIQNMMNAAMYTLAAPVATFMLAYGGFLMVYAGVKGGDQAMYGRSKTIMTNAVIGIIICFVHGFWLILFSRDWERISMLQASTSGRGIRSHVRLLRFLPRSIRRALLMGSARW